MTSFLHAVALVGSEGVTAESFLPYAARILAVLDGTLPGLASDADRRDYHGDEDNLDMELRAIEHVVVSAARGIDTTVPELPRSVMAAAVADGHGRDGCPAWWRCSERPVSPRHTVGVECPPPED